MAHLKKKRIKGNEYWYLVKSYRRNGKVKTRTLKYLGREIPEEYRGMLPGARKPGPGKTAAKRKGGSKKYWQMSLFGTASRGSG